MGRFPVTFRCPGFRFLDHPVPAGGFRFPHGRPTCHCRDRTPSGFPRCTRMRPDRGGRLLDPGAMVSTRRKGNVPAGIRALQRQPYTCTIAHIRAGPSVTRHQQRFTLFARPIFLSPVTSRDARGSSGFPLGFAPRRCQQRTPGPGQAILDTGPRSHLRHQPNLQST